MVPGAEGFPKIHHPVSDVVVYMIPGAVLRFPLFNTPTSSVSEAQPEGSNKLQTDSATRQMKEWETNPV